MMTGSYFGFLLNAGHVWGTSRDLFSRVQEQDGLVSIHAPEGYREGIATGIEWGLATIWKK